MKRSGILIWSLVFALALGVAVASVALATESGAGAASARAATGPDPAVAAWPGWVGRVTCDSAPFDPLVAFASPADAERGRKPSEVALRRHIAKTKNYIEPTKPHSWRLLVETPRYAEFGRGELSNGGVEVNAFERTKGNWHWAGSSSSCHPLLMRDKQEAIPWTLAVGQHPGPSTTTVTVDVEPNQCSSLAVVRKRLERPEFREENGDLLMALWIHPPPPLPPNVYEACGGTWDALKIHLPEPLGERELLDGGVFPPVTSAEQIERDEGI